MKRTMAWAILVLMMLALGAVLARQWQTTALLRIEVESLREGVRDLVRLRAENERMKRERTPGADVDRMRADHAAMAQLRAELETLQAASRVR